MHFLHIMYSARGGDLPTFNRREIYIFGYKFDLFMFLYDLKYLIFIQIFFARPFLITESYIILIEASQYFILSHVCSLICSVG